MTYVPHTTEAVRAAQQLKADNPEMSYRAIGRVLGVHGQTAQRWCDPAYRAHHNALSARRQRRQRRRKRNVPGTRVSWAVADEVVVLAARGMSYRAIADAIAALGSGRPSEATVKKVIALVAPRYRGKPRGHYFGSPRDPRTKAAA